MKFRCLSALLLSLAGTCAAAPPPWSDVVAIPDPLRERFEAQVLRPTMLPESRLERLVDFMFDEQGMGLTYDNEWTRTIGETFESRRGNCLSFTVTFVSLARLAGLRVQMQEIEHALSAFEGEHTVFRYGHVNAVVTLQGRRYTVDFDRDVAITIGVPQRMTEQRIAAHYYNNRGAERMVQGALDEALEHFDVANATDPEFPAPWSNRGVLLARRGEMRAAEAAYRTALQLDGRHVPSLINLAGLLQREGRTAEHERLQRRLDRVRRADPAYNYVLALQHEQRGELAAAIAAYRRAIRLHRREPQFHLSLARALLRSGDAAGAERELARAAELSPAGVRELLQQKIDRLHR